MNSDKIKVLYIGGAGRSGSTLLDLILGEIPGFFSVGELRSIWDRSIEENQLCGCNHPFRECAFWPQVIQRAYGGVEQVDTARMQALHDRVARFRHIPLLVGGRGSPDFRKDLAEYTAALEKLYRAIHEVSGGQIIIDSSKNPSYGFVLKTIPNIDLHVIHLVRDVRAVAYSWQRQRVRPEVHWKQEYMPRFKVTHSVREWYRCNVGMMMFKAARTRYMFMKYEELVRQPQAAVDNIMRHLGFPEPPPAFLADRCLTLTTSHTVAGNPLRFQRESLTIQADNEWQQKMDRRQQRWVMALAWPMLLGYGYWGHPEN